MHAPSWGLTLALLCCFVHVGTPVAVFGQRTQPAQATVRPALDGGQPSSSPDKALRPLRFGRAVPFAPMNALFEQREGWIGADGAYSVPLTPRRILWLFSDTWVGSIRQGKRTDATVVNNSVALQDGRGGGAGIHFIVRKGTPRGYTALITPSDGRGWFWLQAGACVDKRLLLWLSQVEKTAEPGVFGFRMIGQWLGIVANPLDDPTRWRIQQRRLPCTIFTPQRMLTFGTAVLEDGGNLYIYGTDEDRQARDRKRYLIVARVSTAEVEKFSAWRFYRAGEWVSDFRTASHLVGDMASEASVSFLPRLGRYVLVYTEGGLSPQILARSAKSPWGPWSASCLVYRCPEMDWDRRIFCYSAKAHAALADDMELVISYVANSFDFWHVAADARLYWPRFIRVPVQ